MSNPLLVASAVTTGFVVGFLPTLLDSVKAPVQKRLGLSEEQAERGLRCFYLCWLPAMPLAGWLLDHWPNREIFFLGLVGCILGIAWLGLTRSGWTFLGSVVVLGLSYSVVATASIRLMPHALGFIADASAVAALNVGFVFVAVGAVVGPWVAERVERYWGFRQGFLYLSLFFMIPPALVTLTPMPEPVAQAEEAKAEARFTPKEEFPRPHGNLRWAEVFRNPNLLLLAFVILVYFALENCLEVWPQSYLQELGYRERGLGRNLLVFWGVFVLARLGMGWLPAAGYEVWLLLGLVLISAFTMGNLVGANEYSSGSTGFWVVGACYGPLLPGFLALVLDVFPGAGQATALGALLALSGLDTLVVRPLMARLARRHPARTIMRVPTILALVLAAPLLVLALLRS